MYFRQWFACYGILWLLLFDYVVGGVEDGVFLADKTRLIALCVSVLVASAPKEFGLPSHEGDFESFKKRKHSHSGDHTERSRKHVHEIHRELGPYYVRQAYRMKGSWFWDLHRLLNPHFTKKNRSPKKRHRDGAKNGIITSSVRLSVALRYFAGGRPEDISLVHGISHSEVFNSVWHVVDAVNSCEKLAFSFPSDHGEQNKLAAGFAKRSQCGFKTCCAATDGMLLWIERPRDQDCSEAGCGAKKFFCGRKHRFGLNMQGTCDAECRFLDVDLFHPGSTSDFLTFTTSKLYEKLEDDGFLKPGLCIFGDSAYVNNRYFVTPFKGVSSGTKDAFNYYQSQLRIKIECAFGQLVHRWGILRKPIAATVGLKKTVALVICLCRLHNFCINKRLEEEQADEEVPPPLAADTVEIASSGGISLDSSSIGNNPTQNELLDAGNHHDDTTQAFRKQFARRGANITSLPRDALHKLIVDGGYERPTPKGW